jgi:hypothetical protein
MESIKEIDKETYEFHEIINDITKININNIINYKCNFCNTTFSRKDHITNHFNRKKKCFSIKYLYNCSDCKQGFSFLRDYQRHKNKKKKCIENLAIKTKIDNIIDEIKYKESYEYKYKMLLDENEKIKNENKILQSINVSMKDNDTGINNVIEYFIDFYSNITDGSKLFPQPYIAMIILVNKYKNNHDYIEYMTMIISKINTEKEINNFVYPLISSYYFENNLAIEIINILKTVRKNSSKNIEKNKIDKIIQMIHYWILKYRDKDENEYKLVDKHFNINELFSLKKTNINYNFDFNTLKN